MSITLNDVSYSYMVGSPYEAQALKNINIEIDRMDITAVIGHTGSGKSTLAQIFNGLLIPQSGKVRVDDIELGKNKRDLLKVRFNVGLVFQYPEHQIFEETVFKEIAYGPQNMRLSDMEIHDRIKAACEMVNLDEELLEHSPFELSGGQKRKVAIASIVAMMPTYLVLDEPTASLDPGGRREILNMIRTLNTKYNMGIIIISHSMEEVASISNKIIVMNDGQVSMQGSPKEIFKKYDELEKLGLAVPQITSLVRKLIEKGYKLPEDIVTVEEAKTEILKFLGQNKIS